MWVVWVQGTQEPSALALWKKYLPQGSFPSASYFPGAALITDGDNSEQEQPCCCSPVAPAIEIGLLSPGEASALGGFLSPRLAGLQLCIWSAQLLSRSWHPTGTQ